MTTTATTTISLQLTAYQARLLKAAINAEIIKGSSTFLSGRDVINLGRIADSIIDQLDAQSLQEHV
jgi:hypothetical protein